MIEADKLEKKFIELFHQSLSIKNNKFFRTIDRKLSLFSELYVYSYLFNINFNNDFIMNKENISKRLKTILSNKWKIHNIKDLQETISLYSDLYDSTEEVRKLLSEEELKKYSNLSSSIIRKMKIKMYLNEI